MSHQCGGCGGCGSGQAPETEPKLASHPLSQIKTVIGIGGGKGGTGKSLITSLLAAELSKKGKNVGILDGDILSPAIPHMFSLPQGVTQGEEGLYPGLSEGGIKVMSSGLFMEDETEAVTWHSPMMAGVIQQFWGSVIWDQIDVLLIDLPPGTGEVSMAAFEHLPLDGLILVSTPEASSTRAAARTLLLASEKQVPVLGFIENFSGLFPGKALDQLGVRCQLFTIDRLPFDPSLTEAAEEGRLEALGASYLPNALALIEAL